MGLEPVTVTCGKRTRQNSENDNTTANNLSGQQPSSADGDINDEMWAVVNKRARELSPDYHLTHTQSQAPSLPTHLPTTQQRMPLADCEMANIRANDPQFNLSPEFSLYNYDSHSGLDYTDGTSPGMSKCLSTMKPNIYPMTHLNPSPTAVKCQTTFNHSGYTVHPALGPEINADDNSTVVQSNDATVSEENISNMDMNSRSSQISTLSGPKSPNSDSNTHKTGKSQLHAKGPRFVIRHHSKSGRVSVRASSSKDSVKSYSSSTTGTSLEDSEFDENSDQDTTASATSTSAASASDSNDNECIAECEDEDDNDNDEIESDYDFIASSSTELTEPKHLVRGLRPSLFPFVPPYIYFCRHDEVSAEIPTEARKKLKWRLSPITPIVVKKTVEASGFRLLRNTVEWTGQWGKHMKAALFRQSVKDYQKLNHLPGTFQIGRKDRLWKNLQKYMVKYGEEEFGFMPHTYVLPKDFKKLKEAWFHGENRGKPWIIKPPAGARGTGIRVVNKWAHFQKKKPLIVQKYIRNPLLIDDRKFDLRLYVLVTSIHPLKIYLYNDGLVRFAPVKYSNDNSRVSDRYMHLTNYSINKTCELYTKNEDAEASTGHKWTLKVLWKHLRAQGKDVDKILRDIEDIVVKTILCAEDPLESVAFYMPNRYTGYELFGFDIILDDTLKPWLLEVNISPSLHSNSALDLAVKGPLIAEVFNIVGYHLPPLLSTTMTGQKQITQKSNLTQGDTSVGSKFNLLLYTNSLSKTAKSKHSDFRLLFNERKQYLKEILDDLTPDDVRQLITAIDEKSQCTGFKRVFPTPTTHEYFQFIEKPKYYNMLFDAWEFQYGSNPELGIERLTALCKTKIHYHDVNIVTPVEKTISNDPAQLEPNEEEKQSSDASSYTKLAEEEEMDSNYGSMSASQVVSGSNSIENLFVVPTLPIFHDEMVVPPSLKQQEDSSSIIVTANPQPQQSDLIIEGIC